MGTLGLTLPVEMCVELEMVFKELQRAEHDHPVWPEDIIHQVGILTEEVGEAMQAALDITYHGETIEELRAELRHCAAMSLRALFNLPDAGGKK